MTSKANFGYDNGMMVLIGVDYEDIAISIMTVAPWRRLKTNASDSFATDLQTQTHASERVRWMTLVYTAPNASGQTLLDALTTSHGFENSQIKTDPESLEHWGKDWTKHFAPAPSAIVFPKSTEQVQTVVQLANEHGIVLTPSGGRTGLSAGAVASNGEIVISLDKMNRIHSTRRSHGGNWSWGDYRATTTVRWEQGDIILWILPRQVRASWEYWHQCRGHQGHSLWADSPVDTGLNGGDGQRRHFTPQQRMIKNATGYDLRHLFVALRVR